MKITLQDGATIETDAQNRVIGRAPDGNYGQSILGFSITSVPDVNGYPESYHPPQFYTLGLHELPDLPDLRGYHVQLVEPGGGMYGWGVPVEAVEL